VTKTRIEIRKSTIDEKGNEILTDIHRVEHEVVADAESLFRALHDLTSAAPAPAAES